MDATEFREGDVVFAIGVDCMPLKGTFHRILGAGGELVVILLANKGYIYPNGHDLILMSRRA